jgi:uncharacterized membrane protein/mono/diheme cytochrome c family protein
MLLLGTVLAEAATGGAAAKADFSWAAFLGPFHTVVLHMPIGFFTIAVVLEAYAFFQPSEVLRKVIQLVLVLTAASAALAATFGWMRGMGGDYDAEILSQHKWSGIIFAVVVLLTAIIHWGLVKGRSLRGVYWGSLAAGMGLMTIAGHLGGDLTHGSSYLFENAPQFIKNIMGKSETKVVVDTSKDEGAKYYVEQIKPIFEAKCFSCHGTEKKKGGLRLDQRDLVLKGGESGEPAVKLNDPAASYLLRLVMLPADNDDVMPPAGKGTVSEEEIMKLIRWIRMGAPYPQASGAVTNAVVAEKK